MQRRCRQRHIRCRKLPAAMSGRVSVGQCWQRNGRFWKWTDYRKTDLSLPAMQLPIPEIRRCHHRPVPGNVLRSNAAGNIWSTSVFPHDRIEKITPESISIMSASIKLYYYPSSGEFGAPPRARAHRAPPSGQKKGQIDQAGWSARVCPAPNQ